jgi:hypothetical protein
MSFAVPLFLFVAIIAARNMRKQNCPAERSYRVLKVSDAGFAAHPRC